MDVINIEDCNTSIKFDVNISLKQEIFRFFNTTYLRGLKIYENYTQNVKLQWPVIF